MQIILRENITTSSNTSVSFISKEIKKCVFIQNPSKAIKLNENNCLWKI